MGPSIVKLLTPAQLEEAVDPGLDVTFSAEDSAALGENGLADSTKFGETLVVTLYKDYNANAGTQVLSWPVTNHLYTPST